MHSPGINGERELRGQPANPGSPGKWPLKRSVCMCVCVRACVRACVLLWLCFAFIMLLCILCLTCSGFCQYFPRKKDCREETSSESRRLSPPNLHQHQDEDVLYCFYYNLLSPLSISYMYQINLPCTMYPICSETAVKHQPTILPLLNHT